MPCANIFESLYGKEEVDEQERRYRELFPPCLVRGFFLVENGIAVGFLAYCKKQELVIDRGNSLEEIVFFYVKFRLVDQSRRNQGFEIVSCFQRRLNRYGWRKFCVKNNDFYLDIYKDLNGLFFSLETKYIWNDVVG